MRAAARPQLVGRGLRKVRLFDALADTVQDVARQREQPLLPGSAVVLDEAVGDKAVGVDTGRALQMAALAIGPENEPSALIARIRQKKADGASRDFEKLRTRLEAVVESRHDPDKTRLRPGVLFGAHDHAVFGHA